ncbi:DivIVA domain-containing protein [Microtetraspora niveoalba]|uniref:DivIVA domain-containing protein n=1 Tax=Microtetraspora niveoalba TaxID=46175 RepID=UPI000AF68359|nr:DivIVA domain-containing protein [Microtetraspora niveoalba]
MNRFPRVRGVRLGYDPGQVDELVRRIEGTLGRTDLDGPPVTADEIRSAAFRVRRGGYNETAVDFALDAFIVAVEALATSPAPPLQAEGPPPDGVSSHPPGERVPSHPAPDVPDESADEETREQEAPNVSDESADGETREQEAPDGEDAARGEGASAAVPSPGGGAPVTPSAEARTADGNGAAAPTTAPAAAATAASAAASAAAPVKGAFESQAERIERVAFRPGRLGMGYAEDEVDAFLDRVVATLRGTADRPVTAEQVRTATFATVVFKTGYAIADVDAFLAEVADVLERRG